MALPEVIQKVARGLCYVEVERADGTTGCGSGFIVGSSGEVATAAHLLRDGRAVFVAVVGAKGRLACEIAAVDPESDTALLKADARDLPPVPIWRGDPLGVGRDVAFMGFPHADFFSPPLVMTMRGIVGNQYRLGGVDYYVVDASASEGMSGGPLFNAATGDVVALVGGRFDPGRSRAKSEGRSREEVRAMPGERTSITFAPHIRYVLQLMKRRR